ncbi:YggT family protein [Alkalicoccus urumqiensis]|uniref:YggT family protein n=1 Tax=Alkalicoccus urumqiensis TaxID=1548213 RepID=A0A2P6MG92_ALKUR|nr:YggT family protein [Alkalicoccus urumqiensis]PRO65308.1 YggT family protein [Alkalicoccus urumqiensis]
MIQLGNIIVSLMNVYFFICIIYVFMSWIPNARESNFGQTVGKIVEPYFAPFRQIIPPIGMIDISPIVALFALRFAMDGVRFLFFNLLA